MYGRDDSPSISEGKNLTALLRHPKIAPQKCLCRSSSQTDDHFGTDYLNFCVQPGTAGRDLDGIWFFMNAPFATRIPFEVLHRIGYVCFAAINSCFRQCLIQQHPGGTNKRLAFQVFLVARLLADKHHFGVPCSFAEDGLCPARPEVACFTAFCRFL